MNYLLNELAFFIYTFTSHQRKHRLFIYDYLTCYQLQFILYQQIDSFPTLFPRLDE